MKEIKIEDVPLMLIFPIHRIGTNPILRLGEVEIRFWS